MHVLFSLNISLKQEWRTLDDLPKAIIQSPVDAVEEERAHNHSSCQDVRDCSKSATTVSSVTRDSVNNSTLRFVVKFFMAQVMSAVGVECYSRPKAFQLVGII